jgi:pimeloyl-ACP methyl ester carboxylesterase
MNRYSTLAVLLCTALLIGNTAATASDTAKEKRWADQIVDGLFEGEPHYLEADGHKFLAIYTPAAQPKGAVVLLHGIGVHPDWPQVINPLRTRLPTRGWTTLSLQMPILPNEAEAKDYVPLLPEVPGRIKAGIDFLEEKGIKPIVIVGHSMGATMAASFLANTGDPRVTAFVGIGMSGARVAAERGLDNSISLAKIKLPVLDIYGSLDLKEVLDSVKSRADAETKGGNPKSKQVVIDGADHFHGGHEDKLLSTVTGWLGGLGIK